MRGGGDTDAGAQRRKSTATATPSRTLLVVEDVHVRLPHRQNGAMPAADLMPFTIRDWK